MEGHVTAELSVVPISRTARSVSYYVAKCTDILNQAKAIRYNPTPTRTTIEAPPEGVLELSKEIHQRPLEVERQGTNTVPGTGGSYDKSPTTERGVEGVSGKSR